MASSSTKPKILMVLSSHDKLGDTGKKTGFWLEEFAAPYYVFKDAGAEITLASPQGGSPPMDPASEGENFQTDFTRRYSADKDAAAVKLSPPETYPSHSPLCRFGPRPFFRFCRVSGEGRPAPHACGRKVRCDAIFCAVVRPIPPLMYDILATASCGDGKARDVRSGGL